MWPWCTLAASQRRPYCASVNIHSPVRLISSRETNQLAVRCHWLISCIVWPSHSQITSLLMAILALGKARSRREPNLGCRGADRPRCCASQESLHKSWRMGRHIVVMKLICLLSHFECNSHTGHKLSQWRLTADWLSQRENDCSWIGSKVSSDWLPSYIKATWLVLEISKWTDTNFTKVGKFSSMGCKIVSNGKFY